MKRKIIILLLVSSLSAITLILSFQLCKLLPDGSIRNLLPAAPVVNNTIIRYSMFGGLAAIWTVILLSCIRPLKLLLQKNWRQFVIEFLSAILLATMLLFVLMEVLSWLFLPIKSSTLVG